MPLQRSPVLSYLPPPLILCTSLHYSSTFPLFHPNSTEPWPFLYKSLLLESHSSLLLLLRKPSDTFLPDNQHPTAVSQYSTTHRFLFPFIKKIHMPFNTHLCQYSTMKEFHFRSISVSFFKRLSSFGLMFCTSQFLHRYNFLVLSSDINHKYCMS